MERSSHGEDSAGAVGNVRSRLFLASLLKDSRRNTVITITGQWEYGDRYRIKGRKGIVWTGRLVGDATVKPGYFLLVNSNLVEIVAVERFASLKNARECGLLLESWFDTDREWPKPGTLFTILGNKIQED